MDGGVPVDGDLVQRLVREVVLEKAAEVVRGTQDEGRSATTDRSPSLPVEIPITSSCVGSTCKLCIFTSMPRSTSLIPTPKRVESLHGSGSTYL